MTKYLYLFLAFLMACTPKVATTVQEAPKEDDAAKVVMAEAPKEMEVQQPQEPAPVKSNPEPNVSADPRLQPIPMDPRVRRGTLANGMDYYIQKNEKPEDRAELRMAVGVGSINEDDDQLGLAHFVEHMAFNGTTHFEKSELVDYLQSVGTRFGPDLNAYTSFDETVYMLQVRTDSQALFDKGMLVLEDWAQGISFEDEEIDKERGVVESELRSGLSANERMRNEYLPVIFHESKYANRLPIGTREIINNAPYDALKRFYRDWYRPDLMALVVVGDVDVDAVEADIKQRFSKLKNPENPRQREKYGFPDHDETLIAITKDKEASFTSARVMYKHPHIKTTNLGEFRSSLVRSLYNRMLNNRLNELRQAADPPFIYGYSGYGREVGSLDSYTAYVSTGEGQVMKGLQAVLQENRRAQLHGFTASELDRTRIEMISEAETTAKEEDKTESASISMRYVYNFLNDNPVPSPTQRLELVQALLPTIQLEEVNKLTKEWITDGRNRVIVITGPDKEDVPLPAEADILSLIEEVDNASIDPYEDSVSDVPLLADEPSAGTIVSENEIGSIGITELTLSNGIKVVLKPTDFQNDEISFTAFSPGGHSLYPDEDYQSASIASAIINQSGIADFDLIQLQKMMAGKQVNVSPFISELEEGLQGFSTIKDQETMFQLIHLYFTAPRKDEEAFQSIISRQKQILQNLMVNPNYYFRDQVTKIKYGDHIRRGIPTVEDLDKIDLDKVMEVYRDRFADPSDFTFIVIGNFTIDGIKPHLQKYLASIPAKNRNETWKDVEARVTEGKHVKRFAYGEAPKSQVQLNWHGPFDWDERKARYDLGSLMEALRNRLRESMREDQGGVYGVGVSGSAAKRPKEGYGVTISFNAEPDQVDTLIAIAHRDLKDMMTEGPTDEDLVKIKELQRQQRIKNLKENNFWSNSLRRYYSYELDPELIQLEEYEKLVDGLSKEDIRQMAQKIFTTDNYIEVVMMPQESKE